ncbi:centrosomal protein of 85 kDa-like [Tubulanus polymorphus]|uniref:centrosomal protein of 85 kDa-like n=1 Tax=Tubulanus polymorphus TaxID=672921 RepID=UPI003DA6ABC5
MQLENSAQRVQLSELLAKKDQEIESLQQKLGAAEYEFQQLVAELQQKEIIPKTDWKKLQDEVDERDKKIKDMKERHDELFDELTHKKEKLAGLERYVADLPTQDDHNKKEQQLKLLRESEIILKSRISDMESSLVEKQTVIENRDKTIKSYENQVDDLKTKITGLEIDLQRFQQPDKNGQLLASKNKDIDDLRWENQKLHADFDKMKKFMEARNKKFQQVEAKMQAQIKQYEEQTVADENTVNTLQLDLVSKENEIRELRQAMKQLNKTNQELRGKNLSLEDKAMEFDRIMSSSQQRLEKKITKEVNKCVTELQSLVETCLQHSQGQDPNLSMLLGVKASSLSDNEDENRNSADGEDVLRERLARIRNLRKDIDTIRDQVSSKLAEDMGDNINCITQ